MDRPGDPKEFPIANMRLLNNTGSYRPLRGSYRTTCYRFMINNQKEDPIDRPGEPIERPIADTRL